MSQGTIARLHADWEKLVVPAHASALQRREMKRAFFSGAFALLQEQMRVVADPKTPDEDGAKLLSDVQEEGNAFLRDILAGRA